MPGNNVVCLKNGPSGLSVCRNHLAALIVFQTANLFCTHYSPLLNLVGFQLLPVLRMEFEEQRYSCFELELKSELDHRIQ